MVFGILQDVDDDLAADVILARLAERHRGDQRRPRLVLQPKIGPQAYDDGLADGEPAEVIASPVVQEAYLGVAAKEAA